jgi:predicted phage-related endonuclease
MTAIELNLAAFKLVMLRAKKKKLEKQIKKVQDSLKAEIGVGARETSKYLVKCTEVITSRLDVQALREDHPVLCNEYTKCNSYQRIWITDKTKKATGR